MSYRFPKQTVQDVDVQGKTVLLRSDLNVPLEHDRVTDATRIRRSLPTIDYLVGKGARVVVMSHLGRPGGQVVPALRLDPVAQALADLSGRAVTKADELSGDEVTQAVQQLAAGDILLLENTRFDPRETANDPSLARELAALGDLFVLDAFGTAHRQHASTAGISAFLPAVAGLLLEQEVTVLSSMLESPERPFTALVGGAKVSDKIGVLRRLLKRADQLLIGGAMANTFLAAQGYDLADSLLEKDYFEAARQLLDQAGQDGYGELLLPQDLLVSQEIPPLEKPQAVPVDEVPAGGKAADIGPQTATHYGRVIRAAKTVFWNGPMGIFEQEAFAAGTRAMAEAMAKVKGQTIVGGGDSVAAVNQAGFASSMSHISTGGGAALTLVEGAPLPAFERLLDR